MHPAHTLSKGHTSFSGGASANFAFGEPHDAIDAASAEPVRPLTDKPSPAYTRGALAAAAMAPGVSPFVGARVGLGYDAEGGLSYSGRSVRIDARYALQGEKVALSVGAGGSAVLSRRGGGADNQISGLNLDATTGWGLDVPLVVGWRSSGNIVWGWTGTRVGYEQLRGEVGYEAPAPAQPLDGDIDGHRIFALGLIGMAIGFRHFHAAVEIQGGYQHAEAALWDTDVDVSGVSLSPAAALIGKF